jgi:hypothetical protein
LAEGITNSPVKEKIKNSKNILKKVIPLGKIDLKNDNYLVKVNINNKQNKSSI